MSRLISSQHQPSEQELEQSASEADYVLKDDEGDEMLETYEANTGKELDRSAPPSQRQLKATESEQTTTQSTTTVTATDEDYGDDAFPDAAQVAAATTEASQPTTDGYQQPEEQSQPPDQSYTTDEQQDYSQQQQPQDSEYNSPPTDDQQYDYSSGNYGGTGRGQTEIVFTDSQDGQHRDYTQEEYNQTSQRQHYSESVAESQTSSYVDEHDDEESKMLLQNATALGSQDFLQYAQRTREAHEQRQMALGVSPVHYSFPVPKRLKALPPKPAFEASFPQPGNKKTKNWPELDPAPGIDKAKKLPQLIVPKNSRHIFAGTTLDFSSPTGNGSNRARGGKSPNPEVIAAIVAPIENPVLYQPHLSGSPSAPTLSASSQPLSQPTQTTKLKKGNHHAAWGSPVPSVAAAAGSTNTSLLSRPDPSKFLEDTLSLREQLWQAKKENHAHEKTAIQLRTEIAKLKYDAKKKDKEFNHILARKIGEGCDTPGGGLILIKSEKNLISGMIGKISALEEQVQRMEEEKTNSDKREVEMNSKMLALQNSNSFHESEAKRLMNLLAQARANRDLSRFLSGAGDVESKESVVEVEKTLIEFHQNENRQLVATNKQLQAQLARAQRKETAWAQQEVDYMRHLKDSRQLIQMTFVENEKLRKELTQAQLALRGQMNEIREKDARLAAHSKEESSLIYQRNKLSRELKEANMNLAHKKEDYLKLVTGLRMKYGDGINGVLSEIDELHHQRELERMEQDRVAAAQAEEDKLQQQQLLHQQQLQEEAAATAVRALKKQRSPSSKSNSPSRAPSLTQTELRKPSSTPSKSSSVSAASSTVTSPIAAQTQSQLIQRSTPSRPTPVTPPTAAATPVKETVKSKPTSTAVTPSSRSINSSPTHKQPTSPVALQPTTTPNAAPKPAAVPVEQVEDDYAEDDFGNEEQKVEPTPIIEPKPIAEKVKSIPKPIIVDDSPREDIVVDGSSSTPSPQMSLKVEIETAPDRPVSARVSSLDIIPPRSTRPSPTHQSEGVTCDTCNNPAAVRCVDCESPFCQDCFQDLHKGKKMSAHVTHAIDEQPPASSAAVSSSTAPAVVEPTKVEPAKVEPAKVDAKVSLESVDSPKSELSVRDLLASKSNSLTRERSNFREDGMSAPIVSEQPLCNYCMSSLVSMECTECDPRIIACRECDNEIHQVSKKMKLHKRTPINDEAASEPSYTDIQQERQKQAEKALRNSWKKPGAAIIMNTAATLLCEACESLTVVFRCRSCPEGKQNLCEDCDATRHANKKYADHERVAAVVGRAQKKATPPPTPFTRRDSPARVNSTSPPAATKSPEPVSRKTSVTPEATATTKGGKSDIAAHFEEKKKKEADAAAANPFKKRASSGAPLVTSSVATTLCNHCFERVFTHQCQDGCGDLCADCSDQLHARKANRSHQVAPVSGTKTAARPPSATANKPRPPSASAKSRLVPASDSQPIERRNSGEDILPPASLPAESSFKQARRPSGSATSQLPPSINAQSHLDMAPPSTTSVNTVTEFGGASRLVRTGSFAGRPSSRVPKEHLTPREETEIEGWPQVPSGAITTTGAPPSQSRPSSRSQMHKPLIPAPATTAPVTPPTTSSTAPTASVAPATQPVAATAQLGGDAESSSEEEDDD